MGGSSSTRRVVVEENDGTGVVKISDSVVKRIRGMEDSSCSPSGGSSSASRPMRSDYAPQDPAALQAIENMYMDRLSNLETRNAELQRITNEQFCKAVAEVEKKFLKHSGSPVCQDLQAKVYECYLGNRDKTLNCAAEVRAFSTCVEKARQNALCKKG